MPDASILPQRKPLTRTQRQVLWYCHGLHALLFLTFIFPNSFLLHLAIFCYFVFGFIGALFVSDQLEREKKGLKTCESCGAAFTCDIERGEKSCWCFELPKVMPVEEGKSCLCPACLKREIARRTAESSSQHG